ncbi:hypothetical protein WOLCODRAFT_145870 [Wolfiporia cocos MD-104 SS10]|uniref:Uncharacterized protein n=1 Tax=Wolfiporia cocos (strain MD-104) TaxID=742152 RepID=A0A2H3J0U8_WOLCO|nr:hypothetical protein WOLCODRAFT_145870 [Wolfiporia cocos MD-104 SS10]
MRFSLPAIVLALFSVSANIVTATPSPQIEDCSSSGELCSTLVGGITGLLDCCSGLTCEGLEVIGEHYVASQIEGRSGQIVTRKDVIRGEVNSAGGGDLPIAISKYESASMRYTAYTDRTTTWKTDGLTAVPLLHYALVDPFDQSSMINLCQNQVAWFSNRMYFWGCKLIRHKHADNNAIRRKNETYGYSLDSASGKQNDMDALVSESALVDDHTDGKIPLFDA